jgi:hypothetical protein
MNIAEETTGKLRHPGAGAAGISLKIIRRTQRFAVVLLNLEMSLIGNGVFHAVWPCATCGGALAPTNSEP